MRISMLNSDGAGGYEITWIIQNRKYLRRVVDGWILITITLNDCHGTSTKI